VGYWTSEKFMGQIKEAVKIAEVKYPKEEGWKIVWIFDHSSCHAAMPDDALDMNVKPGENSESCEMGFGMENNKK